jgi:hypothetical protein
MKDERQPEPVKQKADELLEVARRRGRGLLDRQKRAAVDELHSVADIMREAAHSFEQREEAGLGSYVEKAAQALDRVSSTLREREVGDLLAEAENGYRKRPAICLAATALAGFAIGRFLRAGPRRLAGKGRDEASGTVADGPAPTGVGEAGGGPAPMGDTIGEASGDIEECGT